MTTKTKTETVETNGNGTGTLSPADVHRLIEDRVPGRGDRARGRVREASHDGHDTQETVTRTLKTQRTWY
jgi:hypothetical protein